jgi:hypothetical protein
MTACPKCKHVRQHHENNVHAGICPRCGIAYAKWQAKNESELSSRHEMPVEEDQGGSEQPASWFDYCRECVTAVPERVEPVVLCGRAVTWCALLAWALYFAWHGVVWEIIGGSFLHNIDLAFHEFGHVFFAPFGTFMMILGGSLFQVLLPLALMCAFSFYKHENFGASVMLWWCGQSFVDLSPYIRDAEYRTLPLVGGAGEESHDWGNLLTMLDAVDSAVAVANVSFGIGCVLMLVGLAWGAYILWLQYLVMKGEIIFE